MLHLAANAEQRGDIIELVTDEAELADGKVKVDLGRWGRWCKASQEEAAHQFRKVELGTILGANRIAF